MEKITDGFIFGDAENNKVWAERANRLQQQERSDFDDLKDKHDKKIQEIRVEVRNHNPDQSRLLTLRAIVLDIVDLLKAGKDTTLYHDVQINLPGFLDPNVFLEYKRREIKNLIGEYKSLEKSIHGRIELKKSIPETAIAVPEPEEHNSFNSVPIEQVREFFRKGLCIKNAEGNQMLSDEDFEKFIGAAFLDKKMNSRLSLKIGNREAGKVGRLFQSFFSISETNVDDKLTMKPKYVELFTKHFDNWTVDQAKTHIRNKPNRSYK